MAKLFFALPVKELAPELIAWRGQLPWPGQPVPQANLHLTLAFLGEADELTTRRLIAAVERQHCPPLTIRLDETGWFSRAKAAWIGPKEWPNELNVLARALRRHGEKLRLGNGEQGYRPHVTLSRKAGEAPVPLPAPDFLLQADEFCLYQSISTPDGVRYKRFLTDVQLDNGEVITIHCANTGAMTGCADPGTQAWYSTSDNPKRKLPNSWEIAESPAGHFICVNTARANQIARELIEQEAIAPLAGYSRLRTEVKYGEENSRIDLLLEDDEKGNCYIEVKSVTLLDEREEAGMGYFPDAVTARGAKHLRELMAMKAAGHRAVLLFMVLHSGISRMRPATHIDPHYSLLIEQAIAAGVEILCYRPHVGVQGMVAQGFIPFESGHLLPEGSA